MSAAAVTSLDLKIGVYPWREWPRLAPVWSQLLESTQHPSFFLTEAWVDTWLSVFGPNLNPSIVVIENAGQPVGICLLVTVTQNRALIPVRKLLLNTSGERSTDTTYMEYNDLLCRRGWEEPVAELLVSYIIRQPWDELCLEGFIPGPAYEALKKALSKFELQELWQPSYYVDLAAIRRAGTPYSAAVGRTMRRRLAQKIRYQSEAGPLGLEPATDQASALSLLDELAELSQRRCLHRGRPALFASRQFMTFHRSLIQKCLPKGSVQLLRVTSGAQTIGLIYNLVHKSNVYFYQCGFHYSNDKRLSPGIVTLSQVIDHCLREGFDDYDFLAGETEYKQWMSTGSRTLVWAVFRKRNVKSYVLDSLRGTKRLLIKLRGLQDSRSRRRSTSSLDGNRES